MTDLRNAGKTIAGRKVDQPAIFGRIPPQGGMPPRPGSGGARPRVHMENGRPRAGRYRTLAPFVAIGVVIIGLTGGLIIYILKNHPWQNSSSLLPTIGSTSSTNQASERHVLFSDNAGAFKLPPENSIEGVSGAKGNILRSTVKEARLGKSINTPYLDVPNSVVKTLSGQPVLVTIWARRPAANGRLPCAIAYTAGSVGSTGWLVFTPNSEFAPFTFAYRMPARADSETSGDRVAIWPDIDGSGKPLEVRLVTIEIAKQ